MARTMSAWIRLVSWYSSTRMWSYARPRAGPTWHWSRPPPASTGAGRRSRGGAAGACGWYRPRRSSAIPRCRRSTHGTTGRPSPPEASGCSRPASRPTATVSVRGKRVWRSLATGARARARRSAASPGPSTLKPLAQSQPCRSCAAAGGRRSGRCRPGRGGPAPARSAARPGRTSSAAARRLKVTSRIRSGAMPSSTSRASRLTSVRVLPVPAPATISSGPSRWSTAWRCEAFKPCAQGGPPAGAISRAFTGGTLALGANVRS